jgi:hypothetical protein
VTAEVYESAPYASHESRDVFNDGDGIYGGNEELLLTLSEEGDGRLGLITFNVQPA